MINGIGCVGIQPIKAYWRDPTESTYFGIVLNHDDFISSAKITWYLMMYTNSGWQISDQNVVTVDIQNYTDWDGSSNYIFSHLTQALGLIIK